MSCVLWEGISSGTILNIFSKFTLYIHLKGGAESELVIRGTYYQGWFMYMRYTQGQNEEYLRTIQEYERMS